MKRTLDERIHDLTHSEMPIADFRQKLLDRQIFAMRKHARWAARRIALVLSQQYANNEIRFISDALMNAQLRHYNVDSGVFKYGRKVIKEKLVEFWL